MIASSHVLSSVLGEMFVARPFDAGALSQTLTTPSLMRKTRAQLLIAALLSTCPQFVICELSELTLKGRIRGPMWIDLEDALSWHDHLMLRVPSPLNILIMLRLTEEIPALLRTASM